MESPPPSYADVLCGSALTLGAFGIYLWLTFALRGLLLPGAAELSAAALSRAHPRLAWLPSAHAALSWPVLLGGLAAGAVVAGQLLPRPLAFGAGALLAVAAATLFSALFELSSGVSPRYGPILRGHSRQTYTVGLGVRRLGLARLAIGLAMAAAVVAGAWLSQGR